MTSAARPQVPLLDLEAQYRPLRDDILAAITRVCDSQRFIMGPEITSLESEMARMLGVRHAIAVSSGTDVYSSTEDRWAMSLVTTVPSMSGPYAPARGRRHRPAAAGPC